ncbi:MAG: precorrin-2 C(20)-methyltransferase [Desulfovibrionaceae bacterium]|jgi:precorrin-2/cobalt-factor-2 C20-methyltransferase|nr:precorrin-2 C(20)-methyltransferase [Desulfovibrionaceae bacterium]
MYGTVYGVGVGPGDPDLLTLKAAKLLQEAERIYAARSTRNTYSVAHDIVAPHLREGVEIETLAFPMTRDRQTLETAWRENAERVITDSRAGRTVCFLTLGDPMTYSTFGYLMRTVRALDAQVPFAVVPGVTSFAAAAAESMTVLAEREETLAVVSGADGGERLEAAAAAADTVVVLKAYKRFDAIRETLARLGWERSSVLLSNCTMPARPDGAGSCEIRDLASVTEQPGYFTLVLARRPRG